MTKRDYVLLAAALNACTRKLSNRQAYMLAAECLNPASDAAPVLAMLVEIHGLDGVLSMLRDRFSAATLRTTLVSVNEMSQALASNHKCYFCHKQDADEFVGGAMLPACLDCIDEGSAR